MIERREDQGRTKEEGMIEKIDSRSKGQDARRE
jgi:hypothetical protein